VPEKKEPKRGPKGGIKHTPGKGHDTKSGREKKKRFRRRAAKKRMGKEENLKRQWDEWETLPPEVQKLRPDKKPKLPRPKDES
jgi:hypothetical protein